MKNYDTKSQKIKKKKKKKKKKPNRTLEAHVMRA